MAKKQCNRCGDTTNDGFDLCGNCLALKHIKNFRVEEGVKEETFRQKQIKLIIKACIGFLVWLGATIWLFLIDYRIGVCVTLIGLSIYNDLKLMIKDNSYTL